MVIIHISAALRPRPRGRPAGTRAWSILVEVGQRLEEMERIQVLRVTLAPLIGRYRK